MTRETKIGLLVGLAFIIVIGILLSDHLTSTTEPPQAQLAQAGSNVRSAVSTPGGSAAPATPLAPTTIVTPQQPVPTREEMSPRSQPVQIVHIGPGGTSTPTPVQARAERSAAPDSQPQPPAIKSDPPITLASEIPGTSALAEVAKKFNEEIITVPSNGAPINSQNVTASSGARRYKAEPGDSVSRLASRFMGGNTKSNRDAIVKANPSLQADVNKIIIGQTYIIPGPASVAAAAPTPAPSVTSPTTSGEYIYTVKAGDSLSKIAVEQLGSVSTIAAIKELNRDVLKDENTIQPNMKLRLPAKPLASAQ